MTPMTPRTLTTLTLLALAQAAFAGRPLASDDAGTAALRTCQVEAWLARSAGDRAWTLAPACGIADGIELGADFSLIDPRTPLRQTGGLSLKWAPDALSFKTAAGALALGVKLGTAFEQPAGAGWRRGTHGALALASWAPRPSWVLHANVGPERDRASGQTSTLVNLALVWAPGARGLVFAEAQASDRPLLFGNALRSAGARWWLVPERLGVDISASRSVGASSTLWTLGLGWYGLGD